MECMQKIFNDKNEFTEYEEIIKHNYPFVKQSLLKYLFKKYKNNQMEIFKIYSMFKF